MEPWVEAFFDLSTDRQIGMGVGPIPHSSIVLAISQMGLDEIEADLFKRCIRAADREFLRFMAMSDLERDIERGQFNQPMTPALFDRLF